MLSRFLVYAYASCVLLLFTSELHAATTVTLKYTDPFTKAETHMDGAQIVVWDLNGKTVQSGTTNGSGQVSLDLSSLSSQVYIIGAMATTAGGSIIPTSNCVDDVINFLLDRGVSAFPGATRTTGIQLRNRSSYVLNITDGYMALAFKNLMQIRNVATVSFGYTPPAINVYWNPCNPFIAAWPKFLAINGTDFFTELISNITGQKIYLYKEFATSAQWFLGTLAHEYGHFVHYSANGNSLPNGPGPSPHYIDSESSREFALVEGWAEFFADYVLAQLGGSTQFDLENFTETHPSSRRSEQEGSVAAFFWDIADDSPNNDDSIVESPAKLLAVIQKHKPNSIEDFNSGWVQLFGNGIEDLYNRTLFAKLVNGFLRLDHVDTGIESSNAVNDPHRLCPETDPNDRRTWRIFNINPQFINISNSGLTKLQYVVRILSGGNTLINADNAPPAKGVGSRITVPDSELGSDGVLSPGESFHIKSNTGQGAFFVCLASRNRFDFFVDVLGISIP